jgi:hypothetical protein
MGYYCQRTHQAGGRRMNLLRAAVIGSVGLAIALSQPVLAQPRTKVAPSEAPHSNWNKPHRVVIQVTQNDPAVMNMALNNAENLVTFYKDRAKRSRSSSSLTVPV